MALKAVHYLGIAFVITLVSARPLGAEILQFQDLTETVSVSGSSRYTFTIRGEQVTGSLAAPTGMVLAGVDGGLLGNVLGIFGGDEGLSDEFYFPGNIGAASIVINFASDPDFFSTPTDCQTPSSPCPFKISEKGEVQTATTINWVNSNSGATASDTIQFASDVDVPEPASILLLLTGLAGLGISVRCTCCASRDGN